MEREGGERLGERGKGESGRMRVERDMVERERGEAMGERGRDIV